MSDSPLRVSEAARRLGIPTREILVLVRERKIGHVMRDGIAHIPASALDEYRARAS
jgi:excisionase family DNA binding protein